MKTGFFCVKTAKITSELPKKSRIVVQEKSVLFVQIRFVFIHR